ncbi:hypothetical protein ACVW1A_000018 [Bradyrhizobium sp. LB1.3]
MSLTYAAIAQPEGLASQRAKSFERALIFRFEFAEHAARISLPRFAKARSAEAPESGLLMPADRRLFDSTFMTRPPAPEIDTVTNNVDDGLPDMFPYEGPPRGLDVPFEPVPFRLLTLERYSI